MLNPAPARLSPLATAMVMAFLALPLSTCHRATSKEDGVRAYLAILKVAQPDEKDLEACGNLQEAELAGDCGLAVASRIAHHGRPMEELCGAIRGSRWQDECVFVAAENAMALGDPQGAARLCRGAGTFVEDCAQHLWQRPLRGLMGDMAPWEFASKLPEVRALYEEWEPLVGEYSNFEYRFWMRYYRNGFEGSADVDSEACDLLGDPDRLRCRRAALDVFFLHFDDLIDQPGNLERFCGLAADDAGAEETKTTDIVTDPLLSGVISRRAAVLCADVWAADGGGLRARPR